MSAFRNHTPTAVSGQDLPAREIFENIDCLPITDHRVRVNRFASLGACLLDCHVGFRLLAMTVKGASLRAIARQSRRGVEAQRSIVCSALIYTKMICWQGDGFLSAQQGEEYHNPFFRHFRNDAGEALEGAVGNFYLFTYLERHRFCL